MDDAPIYLDHAASTPVRPEARAALDAWLDREPGNASSTHRSGQLARTAVEEARERVAAALGAAPSEVVFTSGGTEADNLAVKGLAWARAEDGHRHLVVSAVEHPAVRDTARWLAAHQGFALTEVAPDRDGTVPVERVLDAVRPDTAVVSVMAANNELGAVNDVAALGAALRERGIPFHTDAVQAFATQDVDVAAWAVDALAISGHKFGAPQGVGAAYLRRGVPVVPLSHGGGQDRGVRSGTFAAALDAALGAAVEAAVDDRDDLRDRAVRLTGRLAAGLEDVPGVRRNGPDAADRRLPTHVHVSVAGVDGEALTFALDRAGLRVSAGAACHAGAASPSHVLEAAGIEDDAAIRLSVGWPTAPREVDRAVAIVAAVVERLRDEADGGFTVARPAEVG